MVSPDGNAVKGGNTWRRRCWPGRCWPGDIDLGGCGDAGRDDPRTAARMADQATVHGELWWSSAGGTPGAW